MKIQAATEVEILALQDRAIADGDPHLRRLTYAALGVDARAGYTPVATFIQDRARDACTAIIRGLLS